MVKNTRYTVSKLTVWGNYNTDTREAYLCIHHADSQYTEMLYSATLIEDAEGEEHMLTPNEKIALLIRLLEEKYPCELYDKSAKTSAFRLRQDRILNKLNKLEEEVKNE